MSLSEKFLGWLLSLTRFRCAVPYIRSTTNVLQPSEVKIPKEFLPIGARLLSRGLLNHLTIQANMDWLWPYWVVRQFDTSDSSYTPRGMNPIYLNQTQRNWTAIGILEHEFEAVVDPRGMVTPVFEGWSIDTLVWMDGRLYAPSRADDSRFRQEVSSDLPMITNTFLIDGVEVITRIWAESLSGIGIVRFLTRIRNKSTEQRNGMYLISVRPYNVEGLSPIFDIGYKDRIWSINKIPSMFFDEEPLIVSCSDYRQGDALLQLPHLPERARIHCEAGLGTGVCVYSLSLDCGEDKEYAFAAGINLGKRDRRRAKRLAFPYIVAKEGGGPSEGLYKQWKESLGEGIYIKFPDEGLQRAFDLNRLYLLVLDDGDQICPGPFTYHHYWFRDSAYMIGALDKLGFRRSAERKLRNYPSRQTRNGYFISQEGEWDSNGQAIWTIMEHYRLWRDGDFLKRYYPSIVRGARWIVRKRRATMKRDSPHRGLLSASFSAEHFGPNDYFYWDDLWAIVGLRDTAWAAEEMVNISDKEEFNEEYGRFREDLEESWNKASNRIKRKAIPSSPYRRLDSSMIGNVAALYPLQLLEREDARLLDMLDALEELSFYKDGFIQHMIHSGVNCYLTLHVAQCYLINHNYRAWDLFNAMLDMATPTLTWPEGIHPITGGGCMGDGHHGWAVADMLHFLRNLAFVEYGDQLFLTPIFPEDWLERKGSLIVKDAPTYFGTIGFEMGIENRDRVYLRFHPMFSRPPREVIWTLPRDVDTVEVNGERRDYKGKHLTLPPRPWKAEVSLRSYS